jgi:hypothetical protein
MKISQIVTPGAPSVPVDNPKLQELENLARNLVKLTALKDTYKKQFDTTNATLENIKKSSFLPDTIQMNQDFSNPCVWAYIANSSTVFEEQDITAAYNNWTTSKNNYTNIIKKYIDTITSAKNIFQSDSSISIPENSPAQSLISAGSTVMAGTQVVKFAQLPASKSPTSKEPVSTPNQSSPSPKNINYQSAQAIEIINAKISSATVEYNQLITQVTQTDRTLKRFFAFRPLQIQFVDYMQTLCATYNQYTFSKDRVGFGFKDLAEQLRDGFYYGGDLLVKMGRIILTTIPGENSQRWAKQYFLGAQLMEQKGDGFIYDAVKKVRENM